MLVHATSEIKVITCSESRTISAITFTSDGHIFAGDEGGEIRRWRAEDAQQIGPTMKAGGSIASIVLSKDGRRLVTGDSDRKGIIWNAQNHERLLEVTEHTRSVYAVDISSDLVRFATGSCDKTARIYSTAKGVRLIPPLQHDRAVVGLRFSPGGDRFVTATYDTCIRIYNSGNGERLFEVPVRVMHTPSTPFAWSLNGQQLFVVSPGKITCIDASMHSSSEWTTHNNATRASIVIDGHFVACSAGSSTSFWDTVSHNQIGSLIEHTPTVLCISLCPQEKLIAYGHGKKIILYNLNEILPGVHRLPLPESRSLPTTPQSGPSPACHPIGMNESHAPFTRSVTSSPAKHDGVVTPFYGAISLDPTISVDFLVKRSEGRATKGLWEDALEDANLVIQMDSSCHYAYERRYAALHGMGRYDEAIEAFDRMLFLVEQSEDSEIRKLRSKYVSTSNKQANIEEIIRKTFKHGPLVLIDVTTGRLCDRQVLPDLFKLDQNFKELLSSMSNEIDKDRIRKVVNRYFGYVMFSHVWGNGKEEEKGNEPLFKTVKSSGSVYHLPDAPMNNKLRSFCAKVTELGYRWAWSDTCCIDKSDDAVLNRSIMTMYKWYQTSDVTLVLLDVPSELGGLHRSLWMTRAWTLQEAFVPKRILFYDQDWELYRGIVSDNHKKSDIILEELANATGVPPEIFVSFHPDSLGVRQRLCLASARSATIEEDAAYSLIGIFKSDIIPRYGEGEDALGHLLEGIIAHLGEVTVLAWTGRSSSYHSCLPSTLAVYSQTPYAPPTLDAADMKSRTSQLSTIVSKGDAKDIYYRVMHLQPARFANRRLQLPCIVFRVKSLAIKDSNNEENHYRAKVSRLGMVEVTTADKLPLAEPQRLVVVHPWISDLQGPHQHSGVGPYGSDSEVEMDSEAKVSKDLETDEESWGSPPLDMSPENLVDDHTLALQMITRLRQPFNAFLLLRQPGGREYKRVATESEIIVQISRNYIKPKDIHTDVLDIL